MKLLKLFVVGIACALSACSTDDNTPKNILDNLVLAREMSNATHDVEIYTQTGRFQTGHNEIFLRIKNRESASYVNAAQISWLPVMHMSMMDHSCPRTSIAAVATSPGLYSGHIAFQMAGNATEGWSLSIDYSIDGTAYSVEETIEVEPSALRTVNAFMGSDGHKYVVALVAPDAFAVAQNPISAMVYRMDSMMEFSPVSGYTLKIDPRMPGMGNHSSPNNVDLTSNGGFYSGTLSLTMTGLWRINLILADADGQIIKGEPVTDANPQSSLFFEIEF